MKAGWKTVKLGEVCSFERGLTYSKSDEADAPGITVLRANNVDLNSGQLNFEDLRYIHSGVAVDERKYLSANSIIVCTASGSRDHLGKTAHISEPPRMTFGGFMGLLRPHGEIDSRFLFYLTRSDLYRRLISSLSAGTNINNLKGSDLLSWEIPLPTLVEQKRIVALLDEAFAGIDQAIAKAELNLSSCKIITGLHLKSIFNQSGASDNEAWHKTKLVNIADVQSGSAFPTESQGKAPNGIPFYKVSDMNIKGNERYMINENNSITEDARKELGASIFPKGSVIFPKVGGAIATNKKRITTRECCVDNNVMGAIPKPGKMTSEFLYYFFLAYNLSEFANEAHLPSIKKTTVEEWELSVPRTTQDQERIVEKLNVITDSIQQLTRISEVKIAALAQLKSSLLVKAFAGELSS